MRQTALKVCALEDRRMLAPVDLAPDGFGTSGANLSVAYEVTEATAPAFDIGIYSSVNGSTPGTLLMTHRVTNSADRTVGQHTLNFQAAFNDLSTDYSLLAKLDSGSEASEGYENNNIRQFSGGAFQTTDGTVHVHGTSGSDTISISNGSVTLNGASKSFTGVTAVRARAHGGADTVAGSSAVTVPITAFGGAGNDSLTGGNVNDYLAGGYGDDFLYGLGGGDALYGEDGFDYLWGGYGDDFLWGGIGNDYLNTGETIQDAPVITSFTATNSGNMWTFSGTLSDDGMLSGNVVFGGLLDGSVATLNGNGTFTITVEFPPGTSGQVTVTWTDQESLISNVGCVMVS